MKIKSYIYVLSLIVFITSCKKEVYDGNYDPEIVETYRNESLDSLQTINKIAEQKIQELYDLGLLYVYNNIDNELDSILSTQIDNYFYEKDSNQVNALLNEIKENKTHYIKITDVVNQDTDSMMEDSATISEFQIKYYNKEKNFLRKQNKYVKYILKKNPEKFVKEFKFYFIGFAENDSILRGEIK
ncbi:MAG: hypothetical protein H6604_01660 [Flavobacteriales bacterium]|nr:hypothetical protein [Flavobacteriales bacterium]